MFVTFNSGTRSNLILALGPPLALYMRPALARGIPVRRVLSLGAVAVLLFVFAGLLREIRQPLRSRPIGDVELYKREDGDFTALTAHAYEIYRLQRGRVEEESVFWCIVTNPFPRSWWPEKPELKIVQKFSWYVWGTDISKYGGNTLPSIVGEYLLLWGWWGIVEIGVWLGLLFSLGDRAIAGLFRSWATIAWAGIVCWIFAGFRLLGPYNFHASFSLVVALNGFTVLRSLRPSHAVASDGVKSTASLSR
jgi:hypothetical protein